MSLSMVSTVLADVPPTPVSRLQPRSDYDIVRRAVEYISPR